MNKEKILGEAKERFRRCQSRESNARNNWKSDLAFGYGDDTNNFQWDDGALDTRTAQGKPTFTVNRTKNYCYQILNDCLQNKAQIEVRAVGGGATYQAAQVMEGIVRHIEYISNAQAAYEKAAHDMIFGGIGYFRIVTDYASDEDFSQEIYIRRVPDALSVYLDPHIQQFDGSDAQYAFVFSDMDVDEFKASYPRYKDLIASMPLGLEDWDADWMREDRIRVAEYFRVTYQEDTLHHLPDGSVARESDVEDPRDMRALSLNSRTVRKPQVEWYLIAGNTIVDTTIWPGRYIPICRVVGTETEIEGELDRAGHVRGLRSPQVSYNYYTSAGIEFVALQVKSPFIADVKSIENLEEYWRDANIKNFSVLPYNGISDDGNPLEQPKRVDPPQYAGAFLDGMKIAASEMEMTSGQPPAAMGDTSNERSGKAVLERQRGAAQQTYHFIDHLSQALRFAGKIIIDLIPKIYDVPKVMKIVQPDGQFQTIQIDPNGQQAHQQVQALDIESFDPQQVAMIFAPGVGTYDVVAEVGPQYTTRRQEFVSAMMDMMAENPQLSMLCGDLVFSNLDFPGAQDVAQRMRRVLAATNPAAVDNQDPQIQELQKQLAVQHQMMDQMHQEMMQAKSKAESISYQKEIDYFKAETERLKAVGSIDPNALKPVIREMVSEMLGLPVNELIGAHMHEDALMTQHAANQAKAMAQTDVQLNQGHPPMPAESPPPPANGAAA